MDESDRRIRVGKSQETPNSYAMKRVSTRGEVVGLMYRPSEGTPLKSRSI